MAGARYVASGVNTLTTVADTALTVTGNASTAHRMWLYDIMFGNHGTPADLVSTYLVGQVSAPGTGTGVTPTLLEPGADRAAQAVANFNHTTEPTYTDTGTDLAVPAQGDLLRVPLNHRATYRWVAPPGGEYVSAAVTTDGWGGKTDHASAVTDYNFTFSWIE